MTKAELVAKMAESNGSVAIKFESICSVEMRGFFSALLVAAFQRR